MGGWALLFAFGSEFMNNHSRILCALAMSASISNCLVASADCDVLDPGCGTDGILTLAALARAAQVAPTAPDTLSQLQIWLKADAITGFSGGQALTTWPDSSGKGRNQVGGAAQPRYQTGLVNGLPAVRFTGSSSQFSTGAAFSFQNLTYFLVVDVNNQTTDFVGVSSFYPSGANNDHDNANGLTFSTTAADGFMHVLRMGGLGSSTASPLTALVPLGSDIQIIVLTMKLGPSVGTGAVYRNGTGSGTSSYQDTGIVAPLGLVLGARWITGAASTFGTNDIAEVIAYDRALSEAERQGVECHLSQKYAISIAVNCR